MHERIKNRVVAGAAETPNGDEADNRPRDAEEEGGVANHENEIYWSRVGSPMPFFVFQLALRVAKKSIVS